MRLIRGTAVFFALFVAVPLLGAGEKAFVKTGTVVIRADAKFIAVGIAPAGGGQLERLFIFWPSTSVAPSVKRFERALVEFEPGRLRVSQPDQKEARIYHLAGSAPPPTFEGFNTTTYAGIGLSQYIGGLASRFPISKGGAPEPDVCYLDLGSCKEGAFKAFERER